MAATMIIPFNNQPVNIAAGNASYTVPSGKYAKINICMVAQVTMTREATTTLTTSLPELMDSQNTTFDIWLKSGDVLTSTITYSAGTSPLAQAANSGASGLVTVSVNGTIIAQVRAYVNRANGSGSNIIALYTNNCSYNYLAQEFNNLS